MFGAEQVLLTLFSNLGRPSKARTAPLDADYVDAVSHNIVLTL
jgi:hypothetical protein